MENFLPLHPHYFGDARLCKIIQKLKLFIDKKKEKNTRIHR